MSASMARGRGAVIPGRGQRTCDCRDRVASGVYLLRFPAAVPPLKPALRSRSCRRPSDIECAAPFRLNCKKMCPWFLYFRQIWFSQFFRAAGKTSILLVFSAFRHNFQNQNFCKIQCFVIVFEGFCKIFVLRMRSDARKPLILPVFCVFRRKIKSRLL